jgi:hypothetical protein
MKHILSIALLLALAVSAVAQRSVVVNTNGLLTQPTNFWTANSNAINSVVAGGGSGAAWISTNARTSATNLNLGWLALTNTNATDFLNALGIGDSSLGAVPLYASSFVVNGTNPIALATNSTVTLGGQDGLNFVGTNAAALAAATRVALRIPWAGLTNTNAAGFRGALGLGTNDAVRFGEIATESFSLALNEMQYLGETKLRFNPGVIEVATPLSWVGPGAAENRGATVTNLGLTNIVRTATNGTATASAWLLGPAPTNGVATIATNQIGTGWDELGRFTIQTPVMPISVYETGSPSTPTIYIPGTVVVNRLSAIFFDSRVYASNIVGGPEGGVIPDSVMQASMTKPLLDWQDGAGAAGARGIPYILSNAVTQPETGSYVPYVTTVDNGTGNNILQGRYTNLAGFRSLIEAEVAATNVTVTNAVTLPSARRVIATIDSSLPGSSNTITLRTNNVSHGDTVEARYVRTADSATLNIVDPVTPSTNALMWTRSMFFSYSTNVVPGRWVPVGRTIGSDVVLGTLATNNSVPTGAAAAGDPIVADGAGFSTVVPSRTVARRLTNDVSKTNWGFNTWNQGTNQESAFGTWSLDANSTYEVRWTIGYNYSTNVSGPNHGFVTSGNIYVQTNSAIGWNASPTLALGVITPSSLTALSIATATNATGTRFYTGQMHIPTGTNAVTLAWHWTPVSSNASPLTLLNGSTISVTKIAP